MSDGAGPSTSRTAIVNAFKRARRKFPKNFGISSTKTDDTCQSSDNEDSSEPKNIQDPTEDKSYEQTVTEQIESSLVDSLEEVGISEQAEILCDDCHSNNFESADQEDISTVQTKEEFENDLSEPVNDLQVYENDSKSVSEVNQESYALQESHHSFDIIWKEESDHRIIDIDDTQHESGNFPEPYEILTNASESEEGNRTYEIPEQFHEQETPQQPHQSRRKKHRSGRTSRSSIGYYSCSHIKDYCYACEDSRRLHSPKCPYYGHCVHCQHCHQHCCYHSHCCCNQCCLNWQDRSTHSTRTRDSSPVSRRRSSNHRRSRREHKCSSFSSSKHHSDSSKPSPHHIDTCSRDSGIFTNVRYENEDYDDDNEDTSSNPLLHKDSLSILQEKYASGHYSRRSKTHRAKCDREAASEEDDDDNECRSRKNHKLCRRLYSRCGNS